MSRGLRAAVFPGAGERLLARLWGVLRFDPATYEEIEADPGAIPQALLVVLATSLLFGLGQGSLEWLFLGIAQKLVLFSLVTGLVWVAGAFFVREEADYPLVRCLGFAFAWHALAIGVRIPGIGWLFAWASILLWGASIVLATRQVLEIETLPAVGVCALALATALLVLVILF